MKAQWCSGCHLKINKEGGLNVVQWRNSNNRTFYGFILQFLVTFYFIYTMKFDQKAEYGTIKCSIAQMLFSLPTAKFEIATKLLCQPVQAKRTKSKFFWSTDLKELMNLGNNSFSLSL